MIQEFTHWMLIPETDEHSAFIKAFVMDAHTSRKHLSKCGIRIFGISNRPQGYPTKPEYKIYSEVSEGVVSSSIDSRR